MPHPILLLPLAFGLLVSTIHNGRARELDVRPPRIDVQFTIDGVLDEPVWRNAAVLTGFSQYAPTDGLAAEDSTNVLVWYSPTAIHFGIRAYAEPGTVHATLADRDKIFSDDYIGIFLSTFNDGRQATVFGTNPLGVQGDGIVVERGPASGGFSGTQVGREPTDINPDFVFQSKGRLTDYGYEIEIRIPFKSLRYQSIDKQAWGINVLRKVQSRGQEHSWAPAQRAAASYIGQFGHLLDLTDLRRGLVLDVNPVITARATGAPTESDGYAFAREHVKYGANVRWGVTNNLTLNGTVRPDFAEVEADAGQFSFDPRSALYFAEKRPFFLEGSEQFATPSELIYTRRILSPVAGVKLTGKISGTSIAYLAAVDDTIASESRHDHPIFNVLRIQRDLGSSSRAGIVLTDKEDGKSSNRVAGADVRLVFGKVYSFQAQGVMSRTERPGTPTLSGPLWRVSLDRSGRTFGARYAISGIDDEFRASSGFISRGAVAHAVASHTLRTYGAKDAFVQSASGEVVLDGTWQYQRFVAGDDAIEKKLHFNTNYTLRGGWQAGASLLLEKFGFDDALYSSYAVERHRGAVVDTIAFTGTARIPNRDYVLSLSTPQFRHFSFNAFYLWGRDENFFEWAPSDIGYLSAGATWRPTDRLRMEGTYNYQVYRRPGDGSTVGSGRIPRLKAEYQITRSIFVRAVGQYTANFQDDLRDDSRTNGPLLVRTGPSTFVPALGGSTNYFQADWLFSFLPTPGTVIYAGYASTMTELRPLRFRDFERQRDGFFVKMSYLFRL